MGYAWRPGQTLEELLDDPPTGGHPDAASPRPWLAMAEVAGVVAVAVCWFVLVRPACARWGRRDEIKLYSRV